MAPSTRDWMARGGTMAHNVGRLMRALFGMGTPRGRQATGDALFGNLA